MMFRKTKDSFGKEIKGLIKAGTNNSGVMVVSELNKDEVEKIEDQKRIIQMEQRIGLIEEKMDLILEKLSSISL